MIFLPFQLVLDIHIFLTIININIAALVFGRYART